MMILVENIIKNAVTTYLGKQVSYRKGTGKLFSLWCNQLFGIVSFCKYTETSDCEFFKYTTCRKCFFIRSLKIMS